MNKTVIDLHIISFLLLIVVGLEIMHFAGYKVTVYYITSGKYKHSGQFWLPYKKSFNLYNLWIKFICIESGLAFLIVDPNVWSDFSRTTLVILKTPRNNLYRVWINSAFVCAPIGSLLCWTLIKLPNPPNRFFKSIDYIDIEYTHWYL